MTLLKELLALRERHGAHTEVFDDLDLWQGVGSETNLDSADVEVDYDYSGASHSDHPYGQGTAREHHGASVGIMAVRLIHDTKEYDEDGEKVIGTLKAGTDLMHQPWWKPSWTTWLANKIGENAAEDGDDEPDRDDDRYDDR